MTARSLLRTFGMTIPIATSGSAHHMRPARAMEHFAIHGERSQVTHDAPQWGSVGAITTTIDVIQAFSNRLLLHSLQSEVTPVLATYLHPTVRARGYAGPANCFCGRRRSALPPAMLRAKADTSHAPVLRPMQN